MKNKFNKNITYVMYSEQFDLIYTCILMEYLFPWAKDLAVYNVIGTYDEDTCYEVSPRTDVLLGEL